jgi:P-type Ca2+ transporter type 2C
MVVGGIWSALANIGMFAWILNSGRGVREAMAMTFVLLVVIQFLKAYSFRSDRVSVLNRPFANSWLNWAILWEFALLLLVVYLPFLHEPFNTFSMTFLDWLMIGVFSLSILPVLEIAKWMGRRGWFGEMA